AEGQRKRLPDYRRARGARPEFSAFSSRRSRDAVPQGMLMFATKQAFRHCEAITFDAVAFAPEALQRASSKLGGNYAERRRETAESSDAKRAVGPTRPRATPWWNSGSQRDGCRLRWVQRRAWAFPLARSRQCRPRPRPGPPRPISGRESARQ